MNVRGYEAKLDGSGSKSIAQRAFRSKERVADAYESLGFDDRAGKVRACGRSYSLFVCHSCGQCCELRCFRCDDRLCQLCARSRVARLLQAYGKVLKGLEGARMVTISMRSRPLGELKLAVKELWDAFKRLRHRKIWKLVRGAIAALEITFNPQSQTWHPHLHIVVDSKFIPWGDLHAVWGSVTAGLGTALYIQKCERGWEHELIKYVTKPGDLLGDEAALVEFLGFARKRRFIRTYGTLYNCAVEEQIEGGKVYCSGCGAEMELEKAHVKVEDIYGEVIDYSYVSKQARASP